MRNCIYSQRAGVAYSLAFIFPFQLLQSADVKEDAVLCCSMEVRETHRFKICHLLYSGFVLG